MVSTTTPREGLRHRMEAETSSTASSKAPASPVQAPATVSRKESNTAPSLKPPNKIGQFHRAIRPSRLDTCDPDSDLSRSNYVGLLTLAHILSAVYIIANPTYNKIEKGYFFDHSLASAAFGPFWILMGTWLTCFCWAFVSFGLVQAYLRGLLRKSQVSVIKHTVQAILVMGMSVLIRAHQFAVFPSTFALSVTMIHYMKMHTYTTTSIDLVEEDASVAAKLTVRDFARFLLAPILVYETDYPVSPHPFRPVYFLKKTVLLIGTLMLIYLVAADLMVPVFAESHRYSMLHTWARMVVPLLIMDFLFFYLMFECILNMLAEITAFGDREFYNDWWNCTTWDELARKWNKPVHEFLLRHVYVPSLATKNNKMVASVATFMFSALLHETFLSVTLGVFRPYMFVIMMCQIPLMSLSRLHKATLFGNYYFWFGLCIGVPFLCTIYGRPWSRTVQLEQMSTAASGV